MAEEFKGVAFRFPTKAEMGTLEICRWPGRKQVALSLCVGNLVTPLAYFQSDEKALAFIDWLEQSYKVLGGLVVDE